MQRDDARVSEVRGRDTDGDGPSDGDERRRGTQSGRADSDGDELTDGEERRRGTDPLVSDTDGDGMADGQQGEQTLDLPDDSKQSTGKRVGDAQALYRQNMGQLREAMRSRCPVRERDPNSKRRDPERGGAFLQAERDLLERRGWDFGLRTGYWHPPNR